MKNTHLSIATILSAEFSPVFHNPHTIPFEAQFGQQASIMARYGGGMTWA